MVVSIHQPQYLPWLGLVDRAAHSDVFVLLDSVAYSKNYFYNRNRIKAANGWIWLTVPVLFKGKFGIKIKDITIDNRQGWRQKHWRSISLAYTHAPFFETYKRDWEDFYSGEWQALSQANIATMELTLRSFGVKTPMLKSSEMPVEGEKEELLISICRRLKADKYLSGPDGKNYIHPGLWNKAGIEIEFQEFRHPKYPQLFGDFLPQMAAIDMLFNCGPESLAVLLDDKAEKERLALK